MFGGTITTGSGGTRPTATGAGTNPQLPGVFGGTVPDGRVLTPYGLIDQQMAGWGTYSFDTMLMASVRTRPPTSRFTPGWQSRAGTAAETTTPTRNDRLSGPTRTLPVEPQSQEMLSDRRKAEAQIAGDTIRRAPALGGS